MMEESAFGVVHKANFRVISDKYNKVVLTEMNHGAKAKSKNVKPDTVDAYFRNTNKKEVRIGSTGRRFQ